MPSINDHGVKKASAIETNISVIAPTARESSKKKTAQRAKIKSTALSINSICYGSSDKGQSVMRLKQPTCV